MYYQSTPLLYSKDYQQYKGVTQKLAIFVGSSNVAIVEHFEFVDLLETLDPRYPVPGRTAFSKGLNCVLIELKSKITTHLVKSAFAVMYGQRKALVLRT